MRHLDLPLLAPIPVPAIGTGAMPLSDKRDGDHPMDRDTAIAVLHDAFDLGLTLVDTADIYAPDAARFGHNEALVGEAVRTWSGGRENLVVVTKIGITRRVGDDGNDEWGRDGSLDHLLRAAEASVERLGLMPDAVLLHRVNRTQQPWASTVENLLQVRERGIVPRVGIGNVHLDECETAWSVSGGTIAAVENERSPRYRGDGDIVGWAAERGVAYLAWSPLGQDHAPRLGALYPAFAAVATEQAEALGREISAQQVALAWLSASGASVVPIPAYTRRATAESSAAAADLVLTTDQQARLDASPAGPGSMYPD